MKEFQLIVPMTGYAIFYVDAESSEEAIRLLQDKKFDDYDSSCEETQYDWSNIEVA